jgi:hypothetical protein
MHHAAPHAPRRATCTTPRHMHHAAPHAPQVPVQRRLCGPRLLQRGGAQAWNRARVWLAGGSAGRRAPRRQHGAASAVLCCAAGGALRPTQRRSLAHSRLAQVIVSLLAWKVLYPEAMHLTRGNHESHSMNKMYGFDGEVRAARRRCRVCAGCRRGACMCMCMWMCIGVCGCMCKGWMS